VIFNELMKAVGFDPVKIRDDAKVILNTVKETAEVSEEDLLNSSTGVLGEIFAAVRDNRFFKYTDAWGVGLGRIMELRNVEPNTLSFDRWTKTLRWVNSPRLLQSWDEFCNDQLRMQGVESMQKQLLIREKKRAASRLEGKAAAFDDKKKALQELNEAIDERRAQLIQEEREIKQKYDPKGYDRILAEEKNVSV
jgi:predicted RNase H-like HicB family nuclease